MAHFAKIDSDNVVLNIVPLAEKNMLNKSSERVESLGQAYLETHNNWPAAQWIEYSTQTLGNKYYDDVATKTLGDQSKALRGTPAGIGLEWDPVNQIFWGSQPFPSWTKDVSTASWVSPAGVEPDDLTDEEKAAGKVYGWDEDTGAWLKEDGCPLPLT